MRPEGTAPTQRAAGLAPSESSGSLGDETEHEPVFRLGELVSGTFEVRTLLGEGGMAQVYEAHDHVLDRRVALKASWPDPRLPPLRNEARALAAFRHPSLVTVHGVGEHRGVEYIVMERIYGVPLSEHLRNRRAAGVPFPVDEALGLLIELVEGLAVVHRAGVAHRDVKPGNVMLTPDRRIVLMDFGLVLPEYSVADQRLIAGSPPYMAPEALANAVAPGQGQLVDLYALGVVAFEVLAGKRPYAETELRALFQVLGASSVPDLREVRPDVPEALAHLVSEMLARDPHERPPSAEAIAWRLGGVAARLGAEVATRESLPVARSVPPEPEALEVLVVEDDDDLARILGFYVKKALGEAVALRRAADGVEALERVRERAPQLLLLDIHMPRMNGIEVVMQMRGERLAPGCKVIGVSAGAQEHDLQLLHQLGMHHFVPKDERLRERLQVALRALFG